MLWDSLASKLRCKGVESHLHFTGHAPYFCDWPLTTVAAIGRSTIGAVSSSHWAAVTSERPAP